MSTPQAQVEGLAAPATAFTAQLCGTCSVLEAGRTFSSSVLQYCLQTAFVIADVRPGLPQLARSATSGCDFCKLLHERLLAAPDVQVWTSAESAKVDVVFSLVLDAHVGDVDPRKVHGFVARVFSPHRGAQRGAQRTLHTPFHGLH